MKRVHCCVSPYGHTSEQGRTARFRAFNQSVTMRAGQARSTVGAAHVAVWEKQQGLKMVSFSSSVLGVGVGGGFGFRGRMVSYSSRPSLVGWGSFYLWNELRSARAQLLHPGVCALCVVGDGGCAGAVSSVRFGGELLLAVENDNPIVEGHLLLFPAGGVWGASG